MVTRGNDQPVLALHRQDFEVLEDGKPQAIDLLEEHTAPAGAPILPPRQLPPQVFSNLPAAPRSDSVNVLLLDTLNTDPQDQITLHKQIVDFLGNMKPGTEVAIFILGSKLQLVQGFSTDASLLRSAMDAKKAGVSPGSIVASQSRRDDADENMQQALMAMSGAKDAGGLALKQLKAIDRASLTLQALEQLARYLAGIPGRKNLIWIASSFPVSIFPTVKEQQSFSHGLGFTRTVRETASLLTASKVAVYPVDAQGIHIDRSMDADSGGSSQGDNFSQDAARDLANRTANTAAMEQLASDTGGEAFYASNNLSLAMARAIHNGSHYYTLVYTPTNTQLDGKFRRIEVKLTQIKATLSYRRGYFADDTKAPQAKPLEARSMPDPLPPLLARGLPASTQILYQTRILPISPQPAANAPRAGGNMKLTGSFTRYKVDFVINAKDVALDPATDGNHDGKIEVVLVAYDQAGNALNWTGNTLTVSLNAASYAQVASSGIPVRLEIDLPPTEVSLTTGVYDFTAHKAGTLEIPLHPESAATAPSATPQP